MHLHEGSDAASVGFVIAFPVSGCDFWVVFNGGLVAVVGYFFDVSAGLA